MMVLSEKKNSANFLHNKKIIKTITAAPAMSNIGHPRLRGVVCFFQMVLVRQ